MAIEAVFFDIGGVVVHADLERYVKLCTDLFETDQESLRAEVVSLVAQLETGHLDSAGFWKLVGERLWSKGLGRPADPDNCRGLWRDVLVSSARLDMELIHLCWTLGRGRLVVGALSNTIEDHAEPLERMGAYQPFQPLILSCRTGLRKPDPAIYRLAARTAGVKIRKCLLVDDLEANLEGARAVGMKAYHYTDVAALKRELRRLRLG